MNLIGFTSILFILASVALAIALYPLRKQKAISGVLLPVLILLISSAYWQWGAWFNWREFLKSQERQRQVEMILKTINGKEELISKLKRQLKEKPESARGWYLLGRLHMSEGNWQEASDVFKKAYQLQPDNDQIAVNYAQSLWQLNQGAFNEQIYRIFNKVLKNNPSQPDALAMLAMNAFMSHDYQQAIEFWQRLLKIMPPESEDAQAIRKAIAKAQGKL